MMILRICRAHSLRTGTVPTPLSESLLPLRYSSPAILFRRLFCAGFASVSGYSPPAVCGPVRPRNVCVYGFQQ